MALFNHTYEIKGKHAEYMRKLQAPEALNCRNIDVLFMSIALGISRGLKADVDDSKKRIEPAKIDSEQMVRFADTIEFFYKLLLLSDKKYCSKTKERCNKAFKTIQTSEAEKDEFHFTRVMLGGLEFLYEQIVENTSSKKDVFNNVCDFVDTFD